MPYRRLPATDMSRLNALRAVYTKAGTIAPDELPFSQENNTKLQTFYPDFKKEMEERGNALSVQSEATTERTEAENAARMYISHFIRVFNLGIERGKYKANERAYFNIDISSESLPDLSPTENVRSYAEYIIKGDADRVAAGGAEMTNPSAAEVETVYNDYTAKLIDQSTKKDLYETEQSDVTNKRSEADTLIKDIWDEIEFAFRKDEASTMRRKAREYGVTYVSRPGEPEEEVPEPEVEEPNT